LVVEFFCVNSLPTLIVLQFLSGIIFAGFNFAILNYFYQNVKADLINHISFFYIFQAFAMLAGSLVGAGIIEIGKKVYGNEVQAILLVLVISMAFRFIALIYSRKIKDINRNKVNLYASILLQKPVAYSVKHFWHVLSEQERKILHKLRAK
jgi:MFS family permease